VSRKAETVFQGLLKPSRQYGSRTCWSSFLDGHFGRPDKWAWENTAADIKQTNCLIVWRASREPEYQTLRSWLAKNCHKANWPLQCQIFKLATNRYTIGISSTWYLHPQKDPVYYNVESFQGEHLLQFGVLSLGRPTWILGKEMTFGNKVAKETCSIGISPKKKR
jgi:hypothetical protein